DVVECINMQPMMEMRASIMGGADLRAQWMAEYGIDTGEETRELEVLTSPVKAVERAPAAGEPARQLEANAWIC
ncbi:MAG TPA: hypothetical protein V6C72_02440, partial [Chroococcales cyanobacterium]